MGKTSSTVKDRYNAKAYDEIKVRVMKGSKERIQAAAAAAGESVNGYIVEAINRRMERDTPPPGDMGTSSGDRLTP